MTIEQPPPAASSEHARRNRVFWDSLTDAYQAKHGAQIGGPAPAWGVWQIPESELRVLGEAVGQDVLEFGCGAAQWSIHLARLGARPVGLDLSWRQLTHARRLMREAGVEFPLVEASAEAVPLRAASFDVVFCDYGATTFTDPRLSVPEAARLLRPGGLLAFSHVNPVLEICWPLDEEQPRRSLASDYFGMRGVENDDGSVGFNLTHGDWIRLFRSCGLEIEDLIEPRPAAAATSTYRDAAHHAWARRWPAEMIWKVRKSG